MTTQLADPVVVADSATLVAAVGRAPFPFRHELVGDERLTFAAATSLASTLPERWRLAFDGQVPFVIDRPVPLAIDLPAAIDDVDAGPSCFTARLYHLELVAPYPELVDACIASLPADVFAREGHELERNGAVFVGAPGARVAAHVDRHHNLLFQVAGTKRVMVGRFADPHRQQREIERHVGPGRLQASALPDTAVTFELGPGDGVYVPPYNFHWIEMGGEPSLTFSASWRTTETDAALVVHEVNRRLRSLHIRPAPAGRSVRRDRAKAAAGRVWRRVRALGQS